MERVRGATKAEDRALEVDRRGIFGGRKRRLLVQACGSERFLDSATFTCYEKWMTPSPFALSSWTFFAFRGTTRLGSGFLRR